MFKISLHFLYSSKFHWTVEYSSKFYTLPFLSCCLFYTSGLIASEDISFHLLFPSICKIRYFLQPKWNFNLHFRLFIFKSLFYFKNCELTPEISLNFSRCFRRIFYKPHRIAELQICSKIIIVNFHFFSWFIEGNKRTENTLHFFFLQNVASRIILLCLIFPPNQFPVQ